MIKVDHLVKHYGSLRAVRDVSFEVRKGEVLGFLGPNGAGKSTTMKMITCFVPPTSGTATVKGFSILDNPVQVREQLGYLPESAPLYEDMTVEAFLKFIGKVRRFSGVALGKSIDRVYEICQVKGVRHQPIHTLSKGFRQRVCFAQALLHDPEVLVLDEPTDGLDPNQKHAVRELINSMASSKCILLSTHILEEVDAVCTRAIIISQGEVKFDGSPAELRSRSETHGSVVLTLPGNNHEELKATLKALPNMRRIEQLSGVPEGRIRLRCYPEKDRNIAIPLAQFLKERKLMAEEFTAEQGRLDEVFRSITRSA